MHKKQKLIWPGLCRGAKALHTHNKAHVQMQKHLSADNPIRRGMRKEGKNANEKGKGGGGWWIGWMK